MRYFWMILTEETVLWSCSQIGLLSPLLKNIYQPDWKHAVLIAMTNQEIHYPTPH